MKRVAFCNSYLTKYPQILRRGSARLAFHAFSTLDENRLRNMEEMNESLFREMASVRERTEYLSTVEEMRYYSQRPQTPASLAIFKKFQETGNKQDALIEGALFLHAELPIRVSQSAYFLDKLPRGLAGLDAFQEARETFTASFEELRSFRFSNPATWEDEIRSLAHLFARCSCVSCSKRVFVRPWPIFLATRSTRFSGFDASDGRPMLGQEEGRGSQLLCLVLGASPAGLVEWVMFLVKKRACMNSN